MDIILILGIALFVFLFIGIPVSFALIAASCLAIALGSQYPLLVTVKSIFTGLNSFPLMAIPFFILASELMTGGSMTRVLLAFSTQFVGHLRGGLGYAEIIGITIFSGISGSALADAAGPGAMMIRMMDKHGYDKNYAVALTASTAILGPVFPPSIVMILYAMQDPAVTIRELFLAGLIPGVFIALVIAVVNTIICRRRGFVSSEPKPKVGVILSNTVKAVPALALVAFIIIGIRAGIFTPTEASVIAVMYALICGRFVYRTLHWHQIPAVVSRAAQLSGSVLLMIAAAAVFSWILTVEGVPQQLASWLIDLNLSSLEFLIGVNLLLFVFGAFMEPGPAVMVLAPILAPVASTLGINPIHFAIVMVVSGTMGLVMPPVGALFLMTSAVAKAPSQRVARELLPFFLAFVVMLGVINTVPMLSTWLPEHSAIRR